MSLPSATMIPGLVVTSLSAMAIVLPILGLVVAVMPYVVGAVVALFRREAIFVPHRVAALTRAVAVVCVTVSVLGFVAVQPRFFRPAWGGVPPPVDAGDTALREAIATDVKALIDSLPCAGVVVGVVQPTGNQVFGFGRRSVHSNVPPDGETVFEIGGLTQVFTTSLFARMVETQTVRMNQTVQSLLPDSVSVPAHGGQQLELQHLATWSSGLPALAEVSALPVLAAFPPFSRAHPPRSAKWFYDRLSSLEIPYAPGSRVDDSDLGMGLLGHALERAARTDFETLLQREICRPLGLRDTRVTPSPEMRKRQALGMSMGWGSYRGWHVASPVYRWPDSAVPGAGDLCSTASDLLTLVRAHLAGFPLAGALGETRRPRLQVEGRPDVGLGWYIESTSVGDRIVWQHGVGGACHSYLAFVDGRGVGVVVLANAPIDVDLLGKMILNRLLASGV